MHWKMSLPCQITKASWDSIPSQTLPLLPRPTTHTVPRAYIVAFQISASTSSHAVRFESRAAPDSSIWSKVTLPRDGDTPPCRPSVLQVERCASSGPEIWVADCCLRFGLFLTLSALRACYLLPTALSIGSYRQLHHGHEHYHRQPQRSWTAGDQHRVRDPRGCGRCAAIDHAISYSAQRWRQRLLHLIRPSQNPYATPCNAKTPSS